MEFQSRIPGGSGRELEVTEYPITWTSDLHLLILGGPQALQTVSPATCLCLGPRPLLAVLSPGRPQPQSRAAWIPTGEGRSLRCPQRHRPGRPGSAAPTSCLM